MRKGLLCLVGCFALLLTSTVVSAESSGMYGSVNVGLASATDAKTSDSTGSVDLEFKNGFTMAGSVGYDLGEARVEGEVSWQKNDFDDLLGVVNMTGDVSVLSLLLNGYYDFETDSAFTPFVSAGIGFSKVEVSDFGVPAFVAGTVSDDDVVFAYQIGAGVGYKVSDTVTLDCKYRYFGTADPEFTFTGSKVDSEVGSHNFTVGLRMKF